MRGVAAQQVVRLRRRELLNSGVGRLKLFNLSQRAFARLLALFTFRECIEFFESVHSLYYKRAPFAIWKR